jgi:primosomal protein N' (replication factor Y)
MYIVEVIPISKGVGKETFTYFTSKELKKGSLVDVPMRKKMVPAIVIKSETAHDLKNIIKSSNFVLKKIDKVKSYRFLSPEFIKSAQKTAEEYATTTGAVLSSLIPSVILKERPFVETTTIKKAPTGLATEKLILQAPDEERASSYKMLIREEFAKGSSVFIMLPTVSDAEKIFEQLQKGVEKWSHLLHGSLTPKEIVSRCKNVSKESHPVLIVATPMFLSIPKDNIGLYIVERESDENYSRNIRPFIDYRFFAEKLAELSEAKIIFGDLLLQIKTLQRHRHQEFGEYAPLKWRLSSYSQIELVDMKESVEKVTPSLSQRLKDLIVKSQEQKKKLFVFAFRRGLSSQTVCGDCGDTVLCNNCGNPVALYKESEKSPENFFMCNKCGEKRSAKEYCKNCGSWKLTPLGIGVEKVADEIRTTFPDTLVFEINKDATPTDKKVLQKLKEFRESKSGILVGTEMVLSRLNEDDIDYSAIASVDAMFAIPDLHISEKIFRLICSLRFKTKELLLIQSRRIKEKTIEYAVSGNLQDFFREEIKIRERLGYPPAKTIIKITVTGKKYFIEKESAKLLEYFKDYSPDTLSGRAEKGQDSAHIFIKLNPLDWPNDELQEKLSTLPPNIEIKINPESLL